MDPELSPDPKVGKRQYLITYSKADQTKIPSRLFFGKALTSAFNAGKARAKVKQWAVCLENHQDGTKHYHCCMLLTGPKKWVSVKRDFEQKYKVVLHFSDFHDHYISAYRYVCKEDTEVQHSPGHLDMSYVGSPKTKRCLAAYRQKRRRSKEGDAGPSTSGRNQSAPVRLTDQMFGDFIERNGIHDLLELYAMAQTRKTNGDHTISNYVLGRSEKVIEEKIEKIWKMRRAAGDIARVNTSRLELLKAAVAKDKCDVENCIWLQSAREILKKNDHVPEEFGRRIRELLLLGRGKFRNLMLIGPTNCAKTFLLKPLTKIFSCFENPSNDKYGWVGVENKELILLQDFRYAKELIPWNTFLLLLEGETVKLPAPKNHFVSDIVIDTDIPIFATSKDRIKFKGPYNAEDQRETCMMDSRWQYVSFFYQIPKKDMLEIQPCAKCFATLVLREEDVV